MKLNTSFKDFKKNHINKKNQILFSSRKCNDYSKIENLFRFLLVEKNSFIFESVEKGKTKGRYTIIGLNPDKIWDINKNTISIKSELSTKKIKANPLKFINNLIEKFNMKIPKNLPSMASMLVGYFSYDVIRYIENIPNKCKDDLKIPDVRLARPTNLIIYDNNKKIIYYIQNIFNDTKIKDYPNKYDSIKKKFRLFQDYENINLPERFTFKKNLNKIKSNISKNEYKKIVKKAKNHIAKGDVFQVVLSQRFERKFEKKTFRNL